MKGIVGKPVLQGNVLKYTNRVWPQMGCAGPDGCGYRGPRELFWSGRHQNPYKCPNCGKRYTFLGISSLEKLRELEELRTWNDDLDDWFTLWHLPVHGPITIVPDFTGLKK